MSEEFKDTISVIWRNTNFLQYYFLGKVNGMARVACMVGCQSSVCSFACSCDATLTLAGFAVVRSRCDDD